MKYAFYFGSLVVIWLIFLPVIRRRKLGLNAIIIGIASAAYSLTFETLFGTYGGLYYYVDPTYSIPYMVAASIFLYPPLNILYVLFLPKKTKTVILYTVSWIAIMILFEWASIVTGSIVLTGWRMVPYSCLTYIFTYTWICLFYRYLNRIAPSTC